MTSDQPPFHFDEKIERAPDGSIIWGKLTFPKQLEMLQFLLSKSQLTVQDCDDLITSLENTLLNIDSDTNTPPDPNFIQVIQNTMSEIRLIQLNLADFAEFADQNLADFPEFANQNQPKLNDDGHHPTMNDDVHRPTMNDDVHRPTIPESSTIPFVSYSLDKKNECTICGVRAFIRGCTNNACSKCCNNYSCKLHNVLMYPLYGSFGYEFCLCPQCNAALTPGVVCKRCPPL
jgi:hypothetical protein